MAEEQTDTGEEKAASSTDYEAQAKHFQSIADQRDATNKSLQAELDALKATQKKAEEKALEENNQFKELYEKSKGELAAAQAAAEKASLQVELHTFLAEKHPDFAPDSKWIMPHVTSKEEIASVVEDYVKAHPKAAGVGAAAMGNGGKDGDGQKTLSAAELNDPATLNKKLDEDPELAEKLASGEIKLI
jgi:DNA polymerase III gamma/tau subunit